MAPCYDAHTREPGSPSRSEIIGSVHRLISEFRAGGRTPGSCHGRRRLDFLLGLEHI